MHGSVLLVSNVFQSFYCFCVFAIRDFEVACSTSPIIGLVEAILTNISNNQPKADDLEDTEIGGSSAAIVALHDFLTSKLAVNEFLPMDLLILSFSLLQVMHAFIHVIKKVLMRMYMLCICYARLLRDCLYVVLFKLYLLRYPMIALCPPRRLKRDHIHRQTVPLFRLQCLKFPTSTLYHLAGPQLVHQLSN